MTAQTIRVSVLDEPFVVPGMAACVHHPRERPRRPSGGAARRSQRRPGAADRLDGQVVTGPVERPVSSASSRRASAWSSSTTATIPTRTSSDATWRPRRSPTTSTAWSPRPTGHRRPARSGTSPTAPFVGPERHLQQGDDVVVAGPPEVGMFEVNVQAVPVNCRRSSPSPGSRRTRGGGRRSEHVLAAELPRTFALIDPGKSRGRHAPTRRTGRLLAADLNRSPGRRRRRVDPRRRTDAEEPTRRLPGTRSMRPSERHRTLVGRRTRTRRRTVTRRPWGGCREHACCL